MNAMLVILMTLALPAGEGGITQEFIAEGMTERAGGYRPVRASLSEEGEGVKKAPEDLQSPRFAELEFEGRSFGLILDEPEGEDAEPRLFVDSNADGDFTNDPEATWEPRQMGEYTTYFGSTTVELGEGRTGKVNLYRFDPEDERRQALKDTVLYYADFGYLFTFQLDDQTFETVPMGELSESSVFWLDRNEDGRRSRNYEMVSIGEPFNFTGTTYQLALADAELKLEKADEELPMQPLPPDLRLGKQALEFTATTLEGESVKFPADYAGKIVMLDFWATWCGPCIGEIPHMKEAYEAHHENGFEILGVSFDSEGEEEKLRKFLEEKELPWPQIYEGKGWNTTIGNQHDVSAIPFVLLVDGDTGKILGTAKELRGPGLVDFVGEQLAAKKGQ
jgi:thiol-disulfide isomerase/thioredoxin